MEIIAVTMKGSEEGDTEDTEPTQETGTKGEIQ